jgi:uncharacterized protein (TIGR02453 family)
VFEGFPAETFAWFEGLEADNSKAYFTAQRAVYDRSVRGAVELMLEELAGELGGRVKLFRPNRDIRFSRDKSPYKDRAYGVIMDRPDSLAPLYASISADGLFAGSGYYRLEPDELDRFREAVASDRSGPELARTVDSVRAAGVETFGEALKTAPRGYPRDHPRADLLRHRALFAGARLDRGARGIARDDALRFARATWAACAPLNAWLDAHVG